MEAGLSTCQQLMADPLEEDRTGILKLVSPGESRTTGACGEQKASLYGPPWTQGGDEVVRHTHAQSGNRLAIDRASYVCGSSGLTF